VSWKGPEFDGGKPVIEYLLERREVGKKAWQKVTTIPSEDDGKEPSAEIPSLKPGTSYNLRVFARNEVGFSTPYSPEETFCPGRTMSKSDEQISGQH
jgi:titin